jgi:hypothetical protein
VQHAPVINDSVLSCPSVEDLASLHADVDADMGFAASEAGVDSCNGERDGARRGRSPTLSA